jgi:signal peptidase I
LSKIRSPHLSKSARAKAESVYHFLEWLITALASTLVFIIFMMQVYRIPTGSMADTLKGAHFRLRCEQCGYRYEYDFSPSSYRLKENVIPNADLPILKECRCPSCGYAYRVWNRERDKRYFRPVYKGDQIFVLKCIYQFFQPNRWDVVVFKNPLEPKINYIKRLVGKPGEKVEIIDGDIYINDRIMRKPPKVQEELWMPIYEGDYVPSRPQEERFNTHGWRLPFENVEGGRWAFSGEGSTVFSLEGVGEGVSRLQYNPQAGNDFRAAYAYDPPEFIRSMPICSDLMVRTYPEIEAVGGVGIELGKYGQRYQGWIHSDGRALICRIESGKEPVVLESGKVSTEPSVPLRPMRFANVDHQLILEYGKTRLVHDLGRGAEDAGTARTVYPEAAIVGYGKIRLIHTGLFRDIHYLGYDISGQHPILRGGEGNPVILEKDEFFVCGDNSPYSSDSRWWDRPGLRNLEGDYPAGIVPQDYLVGKAFFVHWPGGYKVIPGFSRFVPYVEGMKVIYGGSSGWDYWESASEPKRIR